MHFLEKSGCWSESQFAYRQAHSCQDALAYVVCSWISLLHKGLRVGVYCSDIKGAFDRVLAELLLMKLERYGVSQKAMAFLRSYLDSRQAVVVIAGFFSDFFILENQVFQGTVLVPKL